VQTQLIPGYRAAEMLGLATRNLEISLLLSFALSTEITCCILSSSKLPCYLCCRTSSSKLHAHVGLERFTVIDVVRCLCINTPRLRCVIVLEQLSQILSGRLFLLFWNLVWKKRQQTF